MNKPLRVVAVVGSALVMLSIVAFPPTAQGDASSAAADAKAPAKKGKATPKKTRRK